MCEKSEEVSSTEWVFIEMNEQEEDLIYRMHRLVGDRRFLIHIRQDLYQPCCGYLFRHVLGQCQPNNS
ncbi:hypothetical protein Patl1_17549 [Pistacia atlantica]|uniref:Uncharacterized protein n=1 Tax=Pistacia atlantica TaxID=434234 RepID=A0ACC1BZJ1_9ROSI|nr:hypothetical protein Patl1_17549 [Pistacia atlantica]